MDTLQELVTEPRAPQMRMLQVQQRSEPEAWHQYDRPHRRADDTAKAATHYTLEAAKALSHADIQRAISNMVEFTTGRVHFLGRAAACSDEANRADMVSKFPGLFLKFVDLHRSAM